MKSAGHAMKKSFKMLLRVVTSFLHHSELPKFSKLITSGVSHQSLRIYLYYIRISKGMCFLKCSDLNPNFKFQIFGRHNLFGSQILDAIQNLDRFYVIYKSAALHVWWHVVAFSGKKNDRQMKRRPETKKENWWRNHVTIFSYGLESWRPWYRADRAFLTMWHEFRSDLSFWLTLFWFDTRLQGTYQHLLFHLL